MIALAGLIWLGMSSLFREGSYFVSYFNESVQGLDVDSPVKYRGVSVGRVERIGVAPDSELIEVVLKLERLETLDKDIVAQLKSVGITGIMFVELDRRVPGAPDRSPKIDFPTKYPVIPSKPSDISELLRGIDDVLKQINAIDLEGISEKVKLTLDGLNKALEDAQIAAVSEGVRGAVHEMRSAVERINRIVEPERWSRLMASAEDAVGSTREFLGNAGRTVSTAGRAIEKVDGMLTENRHTIRAALEGFRAAMENANRFLEKGTALAGNTDETIISLRRHLLYTAQNLETATENLNRITEMLADQPSRLIFGGPPPRRPLESENPGPR